jgi:hypothetical protein
MHPLVSRLFIFVIKRVIWQGKRVTIWRTHGPAHGTSDRTFARGPAADWRVDRRQRAAGAGGFAGIAVAADGPAAATVETWNSIRISAKNGLGISSALPAGRTGEVIRDGLTVAHPERRILLPWRSIRGSAILHPLRTNWPVSAQWPFLRLQLSRTEQSLYPHDRILSMSWNPSMNCLGARRPSFVNLQLSIPYTTQP